MTQAPRVRVCDRDPRRANGIMASGYVPHKQVGHMAAPTSNAKRMFKLANGGPSTHGSDCQALAIPLSSLAIGLSGSAHSGGMLTRTLLGRFFVMHSELHFAVNALALELLFQRTERLVDVVVTNDDLHIFGFCL
jgi:hypothetical protein